MSSAGYMRDCEAVEKYMAYAAKNYKRGYLKAVAP